MKNRQYTIYIEDILNAMDKIEKYISGQEYEEFIENTMAVDAVIRNLEIIGEAAKNIPENIRNQYTEIPWRRMVGLKNIVIHDYLGVDLSIVWRIITKNLPETKQLIVKILNEI